MFTLSPQNKGATETLGFAILIAIAVASSTIVVGLSGGPINALSEQSNTAEATTSFSKIGATSVSTAFNGEGGQGTVNTNFAGPQDPIKVSEQSKVTIKSVDPSDGSETIIAEENMGYMSYQSAEDSTQSVYYENGGVWKVNKDGSASIVTPPEFHYREQTLTFPIIQLKAADSEIHSSVEFNHISTARTTQQISVADKEVHIIISSPVYKGWGAYFEENVDGVDITYDHNNNEVKIVLGLGGQLLSDFSQAALAGGDVTLKGDGSQINGDVSSGGDIKGEDQINGTTAENQDNNLQYLDSIIDYEVTNAKANGTHMDGDNLGGKTLTSGTYYFNDINIDNEELVVDLSDGDVTLAVDGDLYIQNNGGIKVINPSGGDLKTYLEGNMVMEGGSPYWTVENNVTESNVVYASSDSTISLGQQSVFEGVIYAASNNNTSGGSSTNDESTGSGSGGAATCKNSGSTLCMGTNSTIDGAVVTDSIEMRNNSTLNYDSDLSDANLTYDAESLENPRLTYLHTSVSEIEVSEGSKTD